MQDPIVYDTETCGLHGPIVLIQYAEGDGEVKLHSPWYTSIRDTIELIEWMMNHKGGILAFNVAFDHFHLCQMYTTLLRMSDDRLTLIDCLEEYAENEPAARDGDCLKPHKVCDVMLVAQRGAYQSLMNRKPIVIRRVPVQLAADLAHELETRIELKDIYFARRANQNLPKWSIRDCKSRETGGYDPHFKDLVLDFKGSTALKIIANDLLGADRFGRHRSMYGEIRIDRKFNPAELGFAPFALAVSDAKQHWEVPRNFPIKKLRSTKKRRRYAWPAVIEHYARHWSYSELARGYAADDVRDTWGVWKALGAPEPGDQDSELAAMVGAVRWRGYTLDLAKVKKLRNTAIVLSKKAPRSPNEVRDFLTPYLTTLEELTIRTSTKKIILEGMTKWQVDCPDCKDDALISKTCLLCKGTGVIQHKVAEPAQLVLDARKAKKDIETWTKLQIAGRFHASFKVIGTLSNRMSGADDFNAQAVRSKKEVRSAFILKHSKDKLSGGDFISFEVALAEANYDDKKLREQLLSTTECFKCHGQDEFCEDCQGSNRARMKIHALFGTFCFPDMSYEQIVNDKEKYTRSKSGFFSQIYGGNFRTLMDRIGVDERSAMAIEARFMREYEGVKRARLKIEEMFCSMRQPAGIGTQVEWHEPCDYIENMNDPPFRRYFVLENSICKALFELSSNVPKKWKDMKNIKVWRRDREQTVGGAVQSSLYGAAFQIQAANMRAAANHVIQSTGAEITKATQLAIWQHQPTGINRWQVQPMNIHDEIMVSLDPNLLEAVENSVRGIVKKYQPLVPLIDIDWKPDMNSWGEK